MLGKIISMLFGHFGDLIKEGKIKHIGLSNETPWGHAFSGRKTPFTEDKTVQNPYSLLNRLF
jgi:aryl-alcohol dehydrogenase-like predicted oxidoreductase